MRSDRIDVFALARAGAAWQGTLEFACMPRFASELLRAEGHLDYRCRSSIGAHGRAQLQLHIEALATLRCDRCGQEAQIALDAERLFYFVATEQELAAIAIDDSLDEPILGSPTFDLAALIEDEAILQLPISPRHDHCRPPPAELPREQPVERPNPFAELSKLKKLADAASQQPPNPETKRSRRRTG